MSEPTSLGGEHLQFITGRLAETALRTVVAKLAEKHGFAYTIDVLPITVAALMSPDWIARHLTLDPQATRLILPGYCEGDLTPIVERVPNVIVSRGPRDLRRLPEYFGGKSERDETYGAYDIAILAEINHAPRLAWDDLLRLASHYRESGADLIDVGCVPGETWNDVGECVRRLRAEGFRVSIDSLNVTEIAAAVKAGAELVLSVNSSNVETAADWGCEVVAIPDDPATLAGLDDTVDLLARRGVPLRIDPILEPIGCGFGASLMRYAEVRRRYPDVEMMMGIGNLTELTDVDSAGVNVLLLGLCQEWGIRSVLTTEVINWSRSSVRECDLARRLVAYSHQHGVPPKHLEPQLVMLRDAKLLEFGEDHFERLASQLKDYNYRVFAERNELHLVSAGLHLADSDPFRLFERLLHPDANDRAPPRNIDPSHAFYLGFELCKALTALTLAKEYRQDEALDWGFLTQREKTHRLKPTPSRTASSPDSTSSP